MNLDKLIEQYESETTGNAIARKYDDNLYSDDFVLWLANRPTCGLEQRKFLDEIELYGSTKIHRLQYQCDLSKVVKGE